MKTKEVFTTAAITVTFIATIAGLCRSFYKKGYKEGWKDAWKQVAACRAASEERRNSNFKKKHSKKGEKGQSKTA